MSGHTSNGTSMSTGWKNQAWCGVGGCDLNSPENIETAVKPFVSQESLFIFLHKHSCLPRAAFGREHLLGERWLLGSRSTGLDGCWAEITLIDKENQKLFLERVLFLHSLATSRATSAAQQVRLPIAQWEKEIEIACVASYVLKAMKDSIDSENCNARVFSDTVIQQCRARVIEGCPVYK